jgi:hypothetical protein
MTAELEDVHVLLHEKKLSGLQAMPPVLEGSRAAFARSSPKRRRRAPPRWS